MHHWVGGIVISKFLGNTKAIELSPVFLHVNGVVMAILVLLALFPEMYPKAFQNRILIAGSVFGHHHRGKAYFRLCNLLDYTVVHFSCAITIGDNIKKNKNLFIIQSILI